MLLFCPTCANLLIAQEGDCYQFVCSTCPYVHKVTRLVSHIYTLVLSRDRIQQCGTSSGSRHVHRSVSKSPFLSAGTAVSLFHAKTDQQRPLLPREVETWLPDCGATH